MIGKSHHRTNSRSSSSGVAEPWLSATFRCGRGWARYTTVGYARAILSRDAVKISLDSNSLQSQKTGLQVMINHGLLDWRIFDWLVSLS